MGASGFFGIVHPQEDLIFVIIKFAVPVFLKLKTRSPSLPF